MNLLMSWEGDRAPFARALIAAQQASSAVKRGNINASLRTTYADLATVVAAVVPALNQCGVALMQFPAFDGEFVHVATTLLHESGASVTSTFSLRPSQSDPQGLGSATTYARRYSLLAMAGVAAEDDDAEAASNHPAGQVRGFGQRRVRTRGVQTADNAEDVTSITPIQRRKIANLITARGVDQSRLLSWLRIEHLEALPANRFEDALRAVETLAEAA